MVQKMPVVLSTPGLQGLKVLSLQLLPITLVIPYSSGNVFNYRATVQQKMQSCS